MYQIEVDPADAVARIETGTGSQSSAARNSENTPSQRTLQVQFVARQTRLTKTMAAVVADLLFREAA